MEGNVKNDYFCCPFCYRTFNEMNVSSGNVNKKFLERFLLLIKRHLVNDIDTAPVTCINLLSAVLESSGSLRNVISPCTDCSGIMKSFCEYYEEIKVLEMKLEWRLQTLMNIVKSSEKVKFRRRLFQEKLEENGTNGMNTNVQDFMMQLKRFRKGLVKKCSRRFRDSYPKIKLRKWNDCSGENIKTSRKRLNDDIIVDIPMTKMSKLNEQIKGDLLDLNNEPEYRETMCGALVHAENERDEPEISAVGSPAASIIATQDGDDVMKASIFGASCGDENDSGDNTIPSTSKSSSAISNATPFTSVESNQLIDDETEAEGAFQCRENVKEINKISSELETPSSVNEELFMCVEDNAAPDAKIKTTDVPEGEKISMPFEVETVSILEPKNLKMFESSEVKLAPVAVDAESLVSNNRPSECSESTLTFAEDTGITLGRQVLLQERYPCTEGSQTFSSTEKLEKHTKTFIIEENGDPVRESEANNQNSEQDTYADHKLSGEEEDTKAYPELRERPDLNTVSILENENVECSQNNETQSIPESASLVESAKTPEPTTIPEITQGRRVSLRQRYPCVTCSQKFSSSDKLQVHMKTCVNSEISDDEGESESDVHQYKENDYDDAIESEEDDDDTNVLSEEEEDTKIPSDIQKGFQWSSRRRGRRPNMKDKNYNFMHTEFKCESEECNSTFYNQVDLDNHSTLHGDFKCPSCEVTMSYAPDLALHELRHQRRKVKTKSRNLSCPRKNCPYITVIEHDYIQHYITCFLKLSPNTHTCPVCKQQVSADAGRNGQTGKWRIAHHFGTHHDLNDIAPENVARCDGPDCTAYFRTKHQLFYHRSSIHNTKAECEPGPQDYICDDCGDKFTTRIYLLFHRKKFHGNGYFWCDVKGCKRRFREKVGMKAHISLEHSNTTDNTCYFCSQTFKSKSILILHQNQVHGKIELGARPEHSNISQRLPKSPSGSDQVFKCPVSTCPEVFHNRQNLEAHSKLHGNFKCFFCEESKTYAPYLAVHEASCKKKIVKSAKKNETVSCPHCDFEGARSEIRYVQHHLRAHLNLELVVSSMCCICKWVCSDVFNFRTYLAPHYITHHDLRSDKVATVHRCDMNDCDAYFLKLEQLNVHKLFVHNEKRKYQCPDCDKVFAELRGLQGHRVTMHKDKLKFPCTHPGCRLGFDDEQSVQEHLSRRHTTEAMTKEEICSKCGKTFQGLNALVTHTRQIHASEPKTPKNKTHICPECGKQFSKKYKLQNHILCVHVGPEGWQFSCDTCDKKCMTKQKLEEHKNIHSQEKAFTCELCGLSYAHRHNLRIHLKNKHGIIYTEYARRKKTQ